MTHRTGIALVVTFLLGIATAHVLDRPTAAQAPNPALPSPPPNAKYWPVAVNSGDSAYLVLVNVETGDSYCKWIVHNTTAWMRLGPPAAKAEK